MLMLENEIRKAEYPERFMETHFCPFLYVCEQNILFPFLAFVLIVQGFGFTYLLQTGNRKKCQHSTKPNVVHHKI